MSLIRRFDFVHGINYVKLGSDLDEYVFSLTEDIEVDEHITRQHSTLVGDFGSVCIFQIIIIIYSFV